FGDAFTGFAFFTLGIFRHGYCSAILHAMKDEDLAFLKLALEQAEAAGKRGEVPVGAVLISAAGEVLAKAGNAVVQTRDPTAHAEMLVLREGAARLRNERLTGTTLYVTLEP